MTTAAGLQRQELQLRHVQTPHVRQRTELLVQPHMVNLEQLTFLGSSA